MLSQVRSDRCWRLGGCMLLQSDRWRGHPPKESWGETGYQPQSTLCLKWRRPPCGVGLTRKSRDMASHLLRECWWARGSRWGRLESYSLEAWIRRHHHESRAFSRRTLELGWGTPSQLWRASASIYVGWKPPLLIERTPWGRRTSPSSPRPHSSPSIAWRMHGMPIGCKTWYGRTVAPGVFGLFG